MREKIVKCESWTEKMKPDALHMSKGASADSLDNLDPYVEGNVRLHLWIYDIVFYSCR